MSDRADLEATMVLDESADGTVELVARPDGRWWRLLEGVTWGTHGLRYRAEDVRALFAPWQGAAFLQIRRGEEVEAVFTLVPRRYRTGGVEVAAWYRTMLAVRPGAEGRGLGARIARAAKAHFLDRATRPTLLYGFVEDENTRSVRVQEKMGYTRLASFEGTLLGWFGPQERGAVEPARASDLAVLRGLWAEQRRDHVLDDLEESLRLADLWVLRRAGRPVAVAQVGLRKLRVLQLPGLAQVMVALSPVLRHVSPFFEVQPHRILGLAHVAFERPADFRVLAEGLQARFGASSLAWYTDPRSPQRRAAPDLGPIHDLSPSPTVRVMAGWKHLPERVLTALRERPLVLSPLDGA